MSTTWQGVRLEIQSFAKHLIPIISTVTAGNVAYIEDTTKWVDSNGDYLDSKMFVGHWIFRPTAVTTERERRVGGNSGTAVDYASNGRIYHGGPAWSGAPSTSDAYELHRIRPTELFNIYTNVLDQLLVSVLQVLPRGTDLDMETSGTSNWSTSNSSISKVTTAAKVYSGTQALRVQISGASGYTQSATITEGIVPGRQAFATLKAQVDVAGPFYLVAYDVTNSAVIATSTGVSTEGYLHIELQYSIPSTCEQVAYRILGTATSDDGYFGGIFHSVESERAPIKLPSWLNREANLLKVMPARYVRSYASGVFDAYSRVFDEPFQKGRDYELRVNAHFATPNTLEWRIVPPWSQEIWMEALRPASDVYTAANTSAGETSPSINLDQRMVALMVARQACINLLNENPTDTRSQRTLEYIDGPKGIVGPLATLLREYERDIQTVPQERVYDGRYRMTF